LVTFLFLKETVTSRFTLGRLLTGKLNEESAPKDPTSLEASTNSLDNAKDEEGRFPYAPCWFLA